MTDPGRDWRPDAVDLDAYLERIGHAGPREPTAAALHALHRGHVTTFPFENLEIMLGRPIVPDTRVVFDKLVARRRGAYCFEHVTLFAAVLERFGFTFHALAGRVTLGSDRLRPATHALLLVTAEDGGRWIADVGFGSGPLAALPFTDGAHDAQDGWEYRLHHRTDAPDGLPGAAEWAMHQRDGDGWTERHTFLTAPVHPVDLEVLNHYVSTHPRSPFTARPFVQRFTGDVHHQLDDLVHTRIHPDGCTEQERISPADRPALLRDVFDIHLDSRDARVLATTIPSRGGLA